jgi:hypothetical protein
MACFKYICFVFLFFLCGSPSALTQEFYIVNGPNTVTTNPDGSVRVTFKVEHVRKVSYGEYTDEELLLELMSGVPEGTPIPNALQGLPESDSVIETDGKDLLPQLPWLLSLLLQFPIL